MQTQQLASSTLRAVESGRWLVQAAPTGFSAFVDPSGNVSDQTSISEAAVIERGVELRGGTTIAAVVGDAPSLVIAGMILGLTWAGLLSPRREVPEDRHGAAKA